VEGKINSGGYLEIFRASGFKEQFCPYSNSPSGDCICGDWCPHFGEPQKGKEKIGDGGFNLEICQGNLLLLDIFIDERNG